MRAPLLVFVLTLLSPLVGVGLLCADDQAEYHAKVRPVLAQLCFSCHSEKKPAADLRVDKLNPSLVAGNDAEAWHDVLNRINQGEMPPPDSPQPTAEQRVLLIDWITAAIRTADQAKRYAEGRVVTRRLTRYEYQNTMQDLLGVKLDYARELPPDPASVDGFLNNGGTLEMSPQQMEAALAAARAGLAEAIVSGDSPQAHQFVAEKTSVGKVPKGKVPGHEPVNPEFLLDIQTFPRRGEFQLQIQAGANVPPGHDFPRLRVSLGCIPGIIHVPHIQLAEVDVTAPIDQPQTFTFRGRIEDFPQPGDRPFGNVDFNGMVAMVDFVDANGKELRYADRSYVDAGVPKKKPKKNAIETEPEVKPDPQANTNPPADRLDIVVTSVEFQAPVIDAWPPASHQQILLTNTRDAKDQGTDDGEYLRKVLNRFMARAYRRPVTTEEVAQMARLYEAIRQRTPSFEEALRETLSAVLISPHFLYVVEPRQGKSAQRVNDYELASRLSYFLWSSMPDESLFDLAAAGKLHEPKVLNAQVQRMLADPKAGEFTRRFADQWFDLGALDRVAVNPEFFPNFDDQLKTYMRDETRAVLAELLHTGGSCRELLSSNWTMLNRPLAQHYGIVGPRTLQFERVALLPEHRRGGLLGHGAFLLGNSNGEGSHPIKRAVWILDRLLDSPPAPPPPDVPDLNPESPDLAGLSLKQQLEVHRKKEACNSCHRGIDPWGIPLEQFDAVGLWKLPAPEKAPPVKATSKKAAPGKVAAEKAPTQQPAGDVDAHSVLPGGAEINGVVELKRYLLDERQELFARSVVKRLATYALGRSLDAGDRAAVHELMEQFMQNDYRLPGLISQLVQHEVFQTK